VAIVWINLGPIEAGTMTLLNLIKASSIMKLNGFAGAFNLFGLIFWGFGFWWLAEPKRFSCYWPVVVYYDERRHPNIKSQGDMR